jgi:hypothetical protein
LFPIKFIDFHDEIWCNMIPMNVGYAILGRLWIYDLDVTISSRSNSCSFDLKVERSNTLDYHQDLAIRIRKKEYERTKT